MSEISVKHQQLGGADGVLGAAVGPEQAAPWDGLSQQFERGRIFFHAETGAQALIGAALSAFLSSGGIARLGYPLEDSSPLQGGEVAYLERGCVWSGPQGTFLCTLSTPLIGRPAILDPATPDTSVSIQSSPATIPTELFGALWRDRYFLQAVGAPTQEIALAPSGPIPAAEVPFALAPGAAPLQDRRLYGLAFRRASGAKVQISPHAFYAKSSWESFGLIHATDIHVSQRLETFRQRLLDGGQPEGASMFECTNDRLRDMIRAANQLHQAGSLDLILMTGDIIDYDFEGGDNRQGFGNYRLLREILLGRDASSDPSVASEELRVPVFTILGNHDYRKNPYALFAEVEAGSVDIRPIEQYSGHNLIEEEAFVLQGRRRISLGAEALAMLAVDQKQLAYTHLFNDERSYVIRLGANRIVMLDTRHDAGLPTFLLSDDTGILDNGAFAGLSLGDLDQIFTGSPNLLGIVESNLNLLKSALAETVGGGTVIVGVHAPPIDIAGGEYPWYFRETLRRRPEVTKEIIGFLRRHGGGQFDDQQLVAFKPELLPSLGAQPPHFFKGDLTNPVDAGVSRGETEEFMKLCAGEGSARAADIILCGHGHKHTEYRVRREDGSFVLFNDFYSENPRQYYNSRSFDDRSIHIDVAPGGDMTPVKKAWDSDFAEYVKMVTPPNPDPLSATQSSQQASEWWNAHRPIVMQTSSLGFVESRQRVIFSNDSEPEKPGPTFQGFRHFIVRDNTITRIEHKGQAPARKLRGWGRRNVTRLADTGGVAGAVSEVKLLQLDARRLVTVVRGGAGQLLLISWSALLGSNEPGTLTRTGDSGKLAGKASTLDAVSVGQFVVTSCRSDAGKLLLISWRVAANGTITRVKDSGNLAGEARIIRVTAISNTLLVTACQDGDGDLLLIAWRLGSDGSFRRLGDSGSSAGKISDLDLVTLPNNRVATAVRAGNNRLLVISWAISTRGVIRRLADTGLQAGEIEPLSGISACVDHLGRLVVSVRAGDDRLKLILWRIGTSGEFIRGGDSTGQAGKIKSHTLTAASTTGDRSILVSAVRTEAGTLKLITWDLTREGAIRRAAQAGGEAGEPSALAVVAGPVLFAIPALGGGAKFPIVTALRAGNGKLLLISWRAAAPGPQVPTGQQFGTPSGILISG